MDLFDFQKEGVTWLKGRSYALLADEMGLGKTPQGIHWGADHRPCLVVVPAALVLNWAREIGEMWRTSDSVLILDGKQDLPAKFPDWCIMSYGMLDKYLPVLQQAGFQGIIIDEAHNVKNLDAQRTKNVLELVAPKEDPEHPFTGKIIPNRLAITGTPILNRPIELFALMVFLGVKRRSEYQDYLSTYTESKVIKGRRVWTGARNLYQLHAFLKNFMIRRLKKDVLKQLPPKTQTPMFVPITNVQEYKAAEKDVINFIREKKGDLAAIRAASAELIVKMNTLRQLAAEGKVAPVADWLKPCQGSQGKVIIISSFTDPLHKLATIKGDAVVYTGSLAKEERQKAVDEFQETDKYCYFMGSLGAAGVGITLTAANRVVFLDQPWTPGGKIQAEDRAHRIGQNRAVEIVNVLAKGTIDERMIQILAEKEFIISQAIDGKTKDEAVNNSIAMNLIESYMRNPNLNETIEEYQPENADQDIQAVDTATLKDLPGLLGLAADAMTVAAGMELLPKVRKLFSRKKKTDEVANLEAPMKLLTKELLEKLPPLYSQENVADPMVWVKFFTPDGNWTWYGIEYDGKDIFFGYVVGFEKELGYFSLKELESTRGKFGLPIERDKYFEPMPLSKVKELEKAVELDDITGTIAKKLDRCNLTDEDLNKALSWRPLQNFLAWAMHTKKPVQLCIVGMVPGVYQLTIKDLEGTKGELIKNEAIHAQRGVPGIKRVYSNSPELIYEIVVPEENEQELTWKKQDVDATPVRHEQAQQASMFEKSGVVKVTGQCQGNVKTCKFVVKKQKPGKTVNFQGLENAVSAADLAANTPVCSPKEAKKLEQCILRVKRAKDGNPFAVSIASVGCHKEITGIPANVKEAINNPIEV